MRDKKLQAVTKELTFHLEEKEKQATDLVIANKELTFQNEEKEKRADELVIANRELAFQNEEKEKRADELVIANRELAFQNEEKEKRADELVIANRELAFQNEEKNKRKAEACLQTENIKFQTLTEAISKRNIFLLNQAQEIANYGHIELNYLKGTFFVSDNLCKICGLIPGNNTITNAEWISLSHPDDVDHIKRVISESDSAHKDIRFEHRIIRKDGNIRFLSTIRNIIYNADAFPIGAYAVVRDITDEKKSEQALIKTNQLFLFISQLNHTITHCNDVQSLFEAICRLAVDSGKFIMAWIGLIDEKTKNIITVAFAGEERGYLSKINITVVDTPEGNGPTVTALRKRITVCCNNINEIQNTMPWKQNALDSGFNSSIALPIISSGIMIYALSLYTYEINYFDDEEIKLLEGACFDISFTLDRLGLVTKSRQLIKAIEQSNASVVITDTKGNIEYVNPYFTQKTGYTLEEVLGENPLILKSGYTTDNEYDKMWQSITMGKEWSGEFHNKKKNGELFWENASISPVKDAHNNIINFIAIKEDITERKLEAEIKNKVIDDIIQRNKDLEQFSYIVSHNLRSPLSTIMGINNLLQTKELNPEQTEQMLRGLSISVEKLDTIIRDLNLILSVKAHLGEIKEIVKFSAIVHDIIESNHIQITKEKVDISVDFSVVDELFTIKSYLHSIFHNLIENSIKFRHADRHPKIEIASLMTQNSVILTFKDNGLGLDLANKHKDIFGLYKRFHYHVEGKGMGLFMVKVQTETIGGKIYVESEENRGTIFKIVIEHSQNSAYDRS